MSSFEDDDTEMVNFEEHMVRAYGLQRNLDFDLNSYTYGSTCQREKTGLPSHQEQVTGNDSRDVIDFGGSDEECKSNTKGCSSGGLSNGPDVDEGPIMSDNGTHDSPKTVIQNNEMSPMHATSTQELDELRAAHLDLVLQHRNVCAIRDGLRKERDELRINYEKLKAEYDKLRTTNATSMGVRYPIRRSPGALKVESEPVQEAPELDPVSRPCSPKSRFRHIVREEQKQRLLKNEEDKMARTRKGALKREQAGMRGKKASAAAQKTVMALPPPPALLTEGAGRGAPEEEAVSEKRVAVVTEKLSRVRAQHGADMRRWVGHIRAAMVLLGMEGGAQGRGGEAEASVEGAKRGKTKVAGGGGRGGRGGVGGKGGVGGQSTVERESREQMDAGLETLLGHMRALAGGIKNTLEEGVTEQRVAVGKQGQGVQPGPQDQEGGGTEEGAGPTLNEGLALLKGVAQEREKKLLRQRRRTRDLQRQLMSLGKRAASSGHQIHRLHETLVMLSEERLRSGEKGDRTARTSSDAPRETDTEAETAKGHGSGSSWGVVAAPPSPPQVEVRPRRPTWSC